MRSILCSNLTKKSFAGRAPSGLLGELTALPRSPAELRGREGKGGKGEERMEGKEYLRTRILAAAQGRTCHRRSVEGGTVVG